MIAASVSRGHSFKGVTDYLGGAGTGIDRPEWTATHNVGTNNIYTASRVMAADAMDARRRQPKGPVWHGLLSWDESRSPDHATQEAAARGMLEAMGLGKAQAILVGHNDNGKHHVHIVVNLIDPETGRIYLDHTKPDDLKRNCLSNEKRKMQAWALEYCRAHGIDATPNRERNAAAREAAKQAREQGIDAPRPELHGHKRLSRQEWDQMRTALLDRQKAERTDLSQQHGEAWAQVKADRAARQAIERAAWRTEHQSQKMRAKDENRAFWRDTFKRQKLEEAQSWKAVDQALRSEMRSRSLLGRAAAFIGLGPSIADTEGRVAIAKMQHAALTDRHLEQRKGAAVQQGKTVYERTKAALADRARAEADRRQAITDMKAQQEREWQELRDRQQAERDQAGLKTLPPKTRDQDNRPGVSNQEELRREAETARDRLKNDADRDARRERRGRSMRDTLRNPRDRDGRGYDR